MLAIERPALLGEGADRGFDITAMKSLKGDQFEGHAYSFIHRRFMPDGPVPIVPVILNTYYPPNQPSPQRCFDLGTAIRALIDNFPENLRVGIMASGGLSHFLVNEELDRAVVEALRRKDHAALKALPPIQWKAWSPEAWLFASIRLRSILSIPVWKSPIVSGSPATESEAES